jgi:hypothetical protein
MDCNATLRYTALVLGIAGFSIIAFALAVAKQGCAVMGCAL